MSFVKSAGFCPCGNESAKETKVVEEYCWAAWQSRYLRSNSIVLGF
jgi:hypothetical protein